MQAYALLNSPRGHPVLGCTPNSKHSSWQAHMARDVSIWMCPRQVWAGMLSSAFTNRRKKMAVRTVIERWTIHTTQRQAGFLARWSHVWSNIWSKHIQELLPHCQCPVHLSHIGGTVQGKQVHLSLLWGSTELPQLHSALGRIIQLQPDRRRWKKIICTGCQRRESPVCLLVIDWNLSLLEIEHTGYRDSRDRDNQTSTQQQPLERCVSMPSATCKVGSPVSWIAFLCYCEKDSLPV